MVSLIIPNFNANNVLARCLRCLKAQTFTDFEVVIVSFGKNCELGEPTRAEFPQLREIQFAGNRGYAAALNEGIRHAKGDLIGVLHNDAEPDPGWLGELCAALKGDSEAGFCASKIFLPGRKLIDSAGYGIYRWRPYVIGERQPDGEEFSKPKYVLAASNVAALYKREVFDETGLFDQAFFFFMEDLDLGFRAQLRGRKCLYVPTATAAHSCNPLRQGMEIFSLYETYGWRNYISVLIKNLPTRVLLKNFPDFLRWQRRTYAQNFADRKWTLPLRTQWALWQRIGHLLQQRWSIQNRLRIDPEALYKLEQ